MKLKKIGPCKILRKFGENAYEIELPENVGISPIFNIADLYPYREDGTKGSEDQEGNSVGKEDACSREAANGEDRGSTDWQEDPKENIF
jgi:hypothetical protein